MTQDVVMWAAEKLDEDRMKALILNYLYSPKTN